MTLWFFRTPHDVYGLSANKPDETVYSEMDTPRVLLPRNTIYLGRNPPADFPDIQLGECIPVELAPAKAKGGKKKGRK